MPVGAPDASSLVQLAVVTLVAAVIQGTVGFGFTLLAVSFFLLIIQSAEAVPLLIVINLAISLSLVGKLWRHVDRALLLRLLTGALLGFPLGLIVFSVVNLNQMRILVAATILVFVTLTVILGTAGSRGPVGEARFRTLPAVGIGTLAGGLTTALGMPGPPLMLYLTAAGSGKDATRATSLTFFTVAFGAALILQVATGGVTRWVWITAAALVPIAAIGALLGHVLAKRVSEGLFRAAVLVLIAATGVYVLIDTLSR